MPPSPPPYRPDDRWAPFACRWRVEGRSAASIRVSGELDLASAGQLEHAFREALGSARLVLLDMHEVTFMDSTGLHAIMNATASARAQGGHVVLSGVSAEVEGMLDLTGARALLNVLGLPPRAKVDAARRRRSADDRIRPLDNPVNARVVTASSGALQGSHRASR